jgi:hypothetical protein
MPKFNVDKIKKRTGWVQNDIINYYYSDKKEKKFRILKHLHLQCDKYDNMVYLSYSGRLLGSGHTLFKDNKWKEFPKEMDSAFKAEAEWIKKNYE